jgi:hypothetical protein
MPVEGDRGGGAAVEVEPEGEECRWRVTEEEGRRWRWTRGGRMPVEGDGGGGGRGGGGVA